MHGVCFEVHRDLAYLYITLFGCCTNLTATELHDLELLFL
jgi:hypothetical protein